MSEAEPVEVFITFGVQYRDIEHPAGDWIDPDGYVTIVAEDYEAARQAAWELFDGAWAFDYLERPDSTEQGKRWYPLGELKRFDMTITEGDHDGDHD